ncbi:hypothetical protein AYL99_06879 [Fonsecaea erecta]|uniref:Short chain dehydrogenase n=1 Tax=Fonsecaea erecta TaxID=1367422 RepID=A0A178ZJC5_9EURO|nr:hypothetical protein AYL99_06879 [Fonsecaea erecta]OAP59581.1 hypothetical protein AYL99_06879 [Fonsecaea erecta]
MAQNKYLNKLEGDSVLIIGGTSGLGFGVAEACIEFKVAQLYVSSSRQAKIDTTISRLQNAYPDSKTKITGIACNLADEATLESNIEKLFQKINAKLDHIVFTAGDPLAIKPLESIDMAMLKQAGMVRFFAPFFVAKHGRHYLHNTNRSSITFTSGTIVQQPNKDWTPVAGFMSGLVGLTRNLAHELKPIRVNLVEPGAVDTELWDPKFVGNPEARKAFLDKYGLSLATGVVGRVEDVVELYMAVMKDRNNTGAVVESNGGALVA